jgi:hypothetical protein
VLFKEVAGVGSMYVGASQPQQNLEVCVDAEGLIVSQGVSGKHSDNSRIGLVLLLGVYLASEVCWNFSPEIEPTYTYVYDSVIRI